jgi:hypothetical protein
LAILAETKPDAFLKDCDKLKIVEKSGRDPYTSDAVDYKDSDRLKWCKKIVDHRYAESDSNIDRSWIITLPGGLGQLYFLDMAIMGNAGLLLLLSWLLFACRRENQAIKSFVKFSEDYSSWWRAWKLDTLVIIPADQFLFSEHYAYAYHSVSQRFLFMLTSRTRPLLFLTIVLATFPAIVSALHFVFDVRSLFERPFERPVWVFTFFEFLLTAAVWALTYFIINYAILTSLLLNAWLLAVQSIWMGRWDENKDEEAPPVKVDLHNQRVVPGITDAEALSQRPI